MEQSTGGLGEWLKQRCEKERLSLRQAATKTGVSHSTIRDIINGGSASAETIKKLAHGFGSDGKGELALEDKLLVLAGYRTQRPDAEELTEPMACLLEKLSHFSEAQLNIVGRFADFLADMEAEK